MRYSGMQVRGPVTTLSPLKTRWDLAGAKESKQPCGFSLVASSGTWQAGSHARYCLTYCLTDLAKPYSLPQKTP